MLSQDSQLERDRKALFVALSEEIASKSVLQAMERVPRELFVPPEVRAMAYLNIPLYIGDGQTISQPYIVARMAEVLELRGDEHVLEVGTGSGYQAAVLSRLLPRGRLLTVERKPRLAESARARLADLGYANVTAELAGPVLGAERQAPFDAIIVTAACPRLPDRLAAQLAVGGRLVAPVGPLHEQELVLARRTLAAAGPETGAGAGVEAASGLSISRLGKCRFVPLIGPEAFPEQ